MENVAVVDQPKWPALDAVGTPAIMSFKMIWKATDEKILYDDPEKQFRVEGYRATAHLEAQVKVPSIDFFVEIRSFIRITCQFCDHWRRSKWTILQSEDIGCSRLHNVFSPAHIAL